VQLAKFVSSLVPGKASLRRAGIYVPLYIYPGAGGLESYYRVAGAKKAHPLVPMLVAVNPSSGPGSARDANYARAIDYLRSAGISVIGYVYTKWGRRSFASVAADVSRYRAWYGIEGIMVDEFSTSHALAGYYLALRQYSVSVGMTFVMGNPGTDVPEEFVGALADNFTIYENAGMPAREKLAGWHAGYDRANWSCCCHSAPLDERRITAASRHLGFLYATDDTPPNPYDRLSSYFERLVQLLDAQK
jgi:hypothetical protein